ncbi:hypothetical protein BJ878DRAFT_169512 [Calycina marina]|uniref:Uncharacterized protein n=1 Tax=Calycina marina TaxID=1763456 RepID=A0A9P8CEM0_9HELO|nr:hypothetical protein BJ878DRAFT_169512 [Calycina marina]
MIYKIKPKYAAKRKHKALSLYDKSKNRLNNTRKALFEPADEIAKARALEVEARLVVRDLDLLQTLIEALVRRARRQARADQLCVLGSGGGDHGSRHGGGGGDIHTGLAVEAGVGGRAGRGDAVAELLFNGRRHLGELGGSFLRGLRGSCEGCWGGGRYGGGCWVCGEGGDGAGEE